MKKRMLLYFGSFDPVHNGHIALAEYAIDNNLADEVALVISPQNPFKADVLQTPEYARYEMTDMACKASRYPDKIKPSVVEFVLEKPSYTINTLDYLKENHGDEMEFAIITGSDIWSRFDEWREYERILAEYKIYVYPRKGYNVEKFADRVTILADAPYVEYSSTEVRGRAERGEDISTMVSPEVADYIVKNQLWTSAGRIVRLTAMIDGGSESAELFIERGKCYFQHNEWGKAINDFKRAMTIDAENEEARQLHDMVYEILSFRYKDIYNP
ncbi:MAG: nicotinate (nicotinamide) nucleotide adenylyltransferase [Rikenellaceae bacterium]|nr:nicotinate (nicotinamide) nucleotide adenylyltransferase [Rikenellaceae bacterium]